jgi:hypothetical protein
MRSMKQLTMYLWDDSGLTASGNHQVIAALEKASVSSGAATRGDRNRWHRATRPDRRHRG